MQCQAPFDNATSCRTLSTTLFFFWRLAFRLPAVRRVATPARRALLAQFLRFGTVGFIGFLADTAVVYALRHALGLYGAGFASYIIVASGTWLLNRYWTFRGQGSGSWHRQWLRFLLANLLGFSLNRGAYVLVIASVPLATVYPVMAVFAGALAGMFANFTLSRAVVFR